jgi:hypothetical protein
MRGNAGASREVSAATGPARGHLFDLVADRRTAIGELSRVLAPGGTCLAVTNGAQHLRSPAPPAT